MLFPGIQGGPLENIIAAKAVAFEEASKPVFKTYSLQIVRNAKALADELAKEGFRLVSGGTDNHLLNIDFGEDGMTGKDAESLLEEANIVLNREVVPRDTRKPYISSGIRLGSPTVTTRGMKENEMRKTAKIVSAVLNKTIETSEARVQVKELVDAFPFSD